MKFINFMKLCRCLIYITINIFMITYFFKSKIVILLPTGLITDDPSGEKRKSPLR